MIFTVSQLSLFFSRCKLLVGLAYFQAPPNSSLVGNNWFIFNCCFYCDLHDEKDEQKRIFKAALKMWSDVTDLTFSEAKSPSSADLKIRQVKSLIYGFYKDKIT